MKKINQIILLICSMLLILIVSGCASDNSSSTSSDSSKTSKVSKQSSDTDDSQTSNTSDDSDDSDGAQVNDQINKPISLSDASKVVSDMFSDMSQNVEGPDLSSYDNYFIDGEDNPSYKHLNAWVNAEFGSGKVGAADCKVKNVTSAGKNKINFVVQYDLTIDGGDGTSLKTYMVNWTATLKRDPSNYAPAIYSCSTDNDQF